MHFCNCLRAIGGRRRYQLDVTNPPEGGRSVAEISNEEWGKIHAKAWRDPEFKRLLETDPTKAIRDYGKEVGKTFDRIVTVRDKPTDVSEEHWPTFHQVPPACC
jgi:hypothetical protein